MKKALGILVFSSCVVSLFLIGNCAWFLIEISTIQWQDIPLDKRVMYISFGVCGAYLLGLSIICLVIWGKQVCCISHYTTLAEEEDPYSSMHIDMSRLTTSRDKNSIQSERLQRTESFLNDKTERIRLRTLELEHRDQQLFNRDGDIAKQQEEVDKQKADLIRMGQELQHRKEELDQRLVEEMMNSIDNSTHCVPFVKTMVEGDDDEAAQDESSSKSMSSISSSEGDEELFEDSRSSCYDDLRSFARPVQKTTTNPNERN